MSAVPDLSGKSWAEKTIRQMAVDELRDAIRTFDGYRDPIHTAMVRDYRRELKTR